MTDKVSAQQIPAQQIPAQKRPAPRVESLARSVCLKAPLEVMHITTFLNIQSTAAFKMCNIPLCAHVKHHQLSLNDFCEKMNAYSQMEKRQLDRAFQEPDPFLKEVKIIWCALKHFRPHGFGDAKTITQKKQMLDYLKDIILRITDFRIQQQLEYVETEASAKQEGVAHLPNSMHALSKFAPHLNFLKKTMTSHFQMSSLRMHHDGAKNLAILSHMQTPTLVEREVTWLLDAMTSMDASPLKRLQITDTEAPVPFSQKMLPDFKGELNLTDLSSSQNVTTKRLTKLWIENFAAVVNWTIENPMKNVILTSSKAGSTLSNLSFKTGKSGLKDLQIDGLVESPIKWNGTVSASVTFKHTAKLFLENVSIQEAEQDFINQFASAQSKTIKKGFHLTCDNVSGLVTLAIAPQRGTFHKGTFLLRNMRDLTSIVIDRKYKDLTIKVESCPNLKSIAVADADKVKGFVASVLFIDKCPNIQVTSLSPNTLISKGTITADDLS